MIQTQVKLKLTSRQERKLDRWLYHLTAVWNWGIKKIERDAEVGAYHSSMDSCNLLNGHGKKIGVAQDAINGTLWTANTAWKNYFSGISGRPHLKGRRNKLNSIAFAHGTKVAKNRIHVSAWERFDFTSNISLKDI